MAWNCPLCSFYCLLLISLLTHLSRWHEEGEIFRIRCNLDGCEKEYRKANSFVRHVRDRHIVLLHCNAPEENGRQPQLILAAEQGCVNLKIIFGKELLNTPPLLTTTVFLLRHRLKTETVNNTRYSHENKWRGIQQFSLIILLSIVNRITQTPFSNLYLNFSC